jgi:hypothetical protein
MPRIERSDPKEGGAKPPFPEQQQELPGYTQQILWIAPSAARKSFGLRNDKG